MILEINPPKPKLQYMKDSQKSDLEIQFDRTESGKF